MGLARKLMASEDVDALVAHGAQGRQVIRTSFSTLIVIDLARLAVVPRPH
jgi:hypothetical protein